MDATYFENIHPDWLPLFEQEFAQPYMKELLEFIRQEELDHTVYPSRADRFKAFEKAGPDDIVSIICAQDPYINGEANGLAFSIKEGYKIAPSLKNIFKEIEATVGPTSNTNGDLSSWTENVMLLNTCLTTQAGVSGAHTKKGWERFTAAVIARLNQSEKPIAVLSWGKHAHKATSHIDGSKHLIIKTSHPSPLGCRKSGVDFTAFIGSNCFNQANDFLLKHGRPTVNWQR